MKKSLIIIASLLTVGMLIYLNYNDNKSEEVGLAESSVKLDQTQLGTEEKMDEIVTKVDFTRIYNSIEDLTEDASLIIEGKVLETESFNWQVGEDRTVYTKVNVEVEKVLKGDVQVGQVLTVMEPGGITTKEEAGIGKKFKDYPKEQLKEKVKVVFNGVPNMEMNDKVLLFADKTDFFASSLNEEHYVVLGAHQGKFNIKNGKVSRFVPPQAEGDYSPLEMSELAAYQKVKKLINEKL
ncbi:hypothetical protein [Fervidibacillus albus]|uniref:Uncharacterized protein n=1 Tax=Fervidibacillus albus TaxID=2980026 RepID=A0A9E8RUP0_9BACI|nr:hypothetical protein [Fervidibacillus albus]WAA09810.1 hypothetical protein OE104_00045 [Fervidibacillus albus]